MKTLLSITEGDTGRVHRDVSVAKLGDGSFAVFYQVKDGDKLKGTRSQYYLTLAEAFTKVSDWGVAIEPEVWSLVRDIA